MPFPPFPIAPEKGKRGAREKALPKPGRPGKACLGLKGEDRLTAITCLFAGVGYGYAAGRWVERRGK